MTSTSRPRSPQEVLKDVLFKATGRRRDNRFDKTIERACRYSPSVFARPCLLQAVHSSDNALSVHVKNAGAVRYDVSKLNTLQNPPSLFRPAAVALASRMSPSRVLETPIIRSLPLLTHGLCSQ